MAQKKCRDCSSPRGVCVSTFIMAEAGVLNGKRATSHWKFGKELARLYPHVKVESEPIWVKDGNIYTSAGISAGIDLALAWVEEDCGSALAHEVAREFVLFLRRPVADLMRKAFVRLVGTTPTRYRTQLSNPPQSPNGRRT